MKGQATIEYILIISAILVLSLFVISLATNFFSLGEPISIMQDKQYWSSGAFAIKDAIVDEQGDSIFAIKNNSGYKMYLAGYTIDGTTILVDTPPEFLPNETKSVFIPAIGNCIGNCTYKKVFFHYKTEYSNEILNSGGFDLIPGKEENVSAERLYFEGASNSLICVQNQEIIGCEDLSGGSGADTNTVTAGWTDSDGKWLGDFNVNGKFIVNSTTGKIGVGVVPSQKLDVMSGGLRYSYMSAPPACTAALAGLGAGNVPNGSYVYRVTFVNALGQSIGGTISNSVTVADNTSNGQIIVTIPVSSEPSVTNRRLWRSADGGTTWRAFGGATINNNTTTTYTDNTALPSDNFGSYDFTVGSDSGGVYAGSVLASTLDTKGNVAYQAGLAANGGRFYDNVTSGLLGIGVGMKSTTKSGIYVSTNFNYSSSGALFSGVNSDATNHSTKSIFYGYRTNLNYSSSNLSGAGAVAVFRQDNGTGAYNSVGALSFIDTINVTNSGTSHAFVSTNYMQGTGALTNYVGFLSHGQIATASPTVTNQYDFKASNFSSAANGTITNRYGLYIDIDTTGTTNPWGVYQTSADTMNYFNGNVGIGTTTPQNKLNVIGDINATGSGIIGTGGSANHAVCWKADGKTLGYCSDAVGVDGSCTCN